MEREAASAELARLSSEGFFADGNYGVERMCGAIAELKCLKVAQASQHYLCDGMSTQRLPSIRDPAARRAACKDMLMYLLQIQLLRSISASQFTGALAKSLRPRLADSGENARRETTEQLINTASCFA